MSAAAGSAPAPDVVVLLVHGIGQQRPGSVVNDVGNALFEWMAVRYERIGRVEVESTVLKPDVRGGTDAATATLLVRDANGTPHRIKVVESLWAEEFDAPGFLGVLGWALGAGVWLVFHRVRRDFDALPRNGTAVAVLAHSQGAAVVLEMLECHPNPAPLVTYGAGSRKLHELVNETGDVKVPLTFRILWLLSLCSLVATVGVIANVLQVSGGNLAPDPLAGLAFLVLTVLFVLGAILWRSSTTGAS